MPSPSYESLVALLRDTLRTCPDGIESVLRNARRSYADLLADALSSGATDDPKCDQCGGDVRVITSKRVGESQKQRVECRACGHRDWHIEHRARIAPRN